MGFPDVIHLVEVIRHSLTSFHFPAGELPLLDKSPSSVFLWAWGLSTLKKFLLALLLQLNFYYYYFFLQWCAGVSYGKPGFLQVLFRV